MNNLFTKQVITAFTVGRYGGVRYYTAIPLGSFGEVSGQFWAGFGKVLEGKRGAEKTEQIVENLYIKAFTRPL